MKVPNKFPRVQVSEDKWSSSIVVELELKENI